MDVTGLIQLGMEYFNARIRGYTFSRLMNYGPWMVVGLYNKINKAEENNFPSPEAGYLEPILSFPYLCNGNR